MESDPIEALSARIALVSCEQVSKRGEARREGEYKSVH